MMNRPRISRLTRSCVAAALGASAWSVSPVAHAQAAAPALAPGQKPPCVPASAYMLGYDCELFPLPNAPAAPAPAAAPAVVVAVVPVPVVVPVAAPPAPAVAVPAAGGAAVAVPTPAEEPPPADATVVVTPPPPAPTPPADSSGGVSHGPAYAMFGVGAAGIVVTVIFGSLALSNKSTLNGECPSSSTCPSTASSTVSSLKTDGILADVGLGVAVVGVGLGAILFATEHGPSSGTGGLRVQPWIGLTSGGLKGSF